MPEGDTVWRAARLLDRALAGQVLTRSDFRVPQWATVDLAGTRVLHTATHGKHLLTRIDADEALTLHTHLKMEGTWQVHAPGGRLRRPAHTVRVVLETASAVAVGHGLGVVELLAREDEERVLAHLGPDLLAADLDPATVAHRLVADAGTPVVQALQDQRRMAGLGNMYACELAFLAGLHPLTPIGAVADAPRLVRRAALLLEQNKERPQQSTTGDLRPGRRTWVYRQRTCRRCGTRIRVAPVGETGRERTTYWCPSCQPG